LTPRQKCRSTTSRLWADSIATGKEREPLRERPEILAAVTGGRELETAFVRLHRRFCAADDGGVEDTIHVATGALKRSFVVDASG
jgi:hypothetical protein